MNAEFSCACGQKQWIVMQTSMNHGYVECQTCDTRVLFDLVTIEYSV